MSDHNHNSAQPSFDPALLISQYFYGTLSSDDRKRLSDWVAESDRNASLFAEEAMVHHFAQDYCIAHDQLEMSKSICEDSCNDASEGFAEVIDQQLEKQEQLKDDSGQYELIAQKQLIESGRREAIKAKRSKSTGSNAGMVFCFAGVNVYRSSGSTRYGHTQPLNNGKWVKAAVIGMLCVVGYLWWSQPEPGAVTPVAVAQVTHAVNQLWNKPLAVGDMLCTGDQLILKRGFSEITFYDGTTVLLEAPCELTVTHANALYLSRGKLVAKVISDDPDFRVFTDNACIIDRGTEFGVFANESGQVDVAVFKGRVELNERTQNNELGQSLELTAGWAGRIEEEGTLRTTPVALDPEDTMFVTQKPRSKYEAMVLKSRPAMYWQFNEDPENQKITSLGSQTLTGQLKGNASINASGIDGRAVQFADRLDYLEIENFDTPWMKSNFTIEAWINPLSRQQARSPLMRLISSRDSTIPSIHSTHGFGWGVASKGDGNWQPRFTLFGFREYRGKMVIPPDQWTHMVVTVSVNGQVEMFVNGQKIETTTNPQNNQDITPIEELPDDSMRMAIGCNPPYFKLTDLESWEGQLDEIAVYKCVLTEDEIAKHYRAAH